MGHVGVALPRGGRLDDAVDAFARAVAIDPTDAEIWFGWGQPRRERGLYEDALTACDRALAIDAEHCGCLERPGVALHELGRPE